MLIVGPAARAATVYGPGATAEFVAGKAGWGPDSSASCTVAGYWQVTDLGQAGIAYSGKCSTSWNIASAIVTFSVDGEPCHGTGGPGEVDGHPDFAGVITMGAGCGPVLSLCYSVSLQRNTDAWLGDDWGRFTDSDCVPWALGAPPEVGGPSGACDYATAVKVAAGAVYVAYNGNSRPAPWRDYTTTWSGGTVADASEWRAYVLYAAPASSSSVAVKTSDLGTAWLGGQHLYGRMKSFAAASGGGVWSQQEGAQDTSVSVTGPPVGVGVYRVDGVASSQQAQRQTAWQYPVGSLTYAVGGSTDAGVCQFYWGQRVADDPASDRDDPVGPLTIAGQDQPPPDVTAPEPVDPTGGSCAGFSFTDPASWAGAGICVLVKTVMRLVDAVAALPGAIASAVGDLLQALFVPPDGAFEDALDEIQSAWSTAAPFTFLSGVGDVGTAFTGFSAGSSCEGPTLAFTEPVGGHAVSLHPLDACEAPVSTLATIVRTALTLAVYVGGFLVAARIVGASLGLRDVVPGAGDGQ